jgi:hypothetical protein
MRLYQFWDSLRNVPDDVKVIKNDLMLLTNVLGDIAQEKDLSPAVRLKIHLLNFKTRTSLDSLKGDDEKPAISEVPRSFKWCQEHVDA